MKEISNIIGAPVPLNLTQCLLSNFDESIMDLVCKPLIIFSVSSWSFGHIAVGLSFKYLVQLSNVYAHF